jgi:hypothetical protein
VKGILEIKKRIHRRRIVLLGALWIILLIATVSLLSFLEFTFGNDPNSRVIKSTSWSGYIITKEFNNNHLINAITAEWEVPTINILATKTYSSAWIGIGGQSDKTLIQIGTEHDAVNGNANYRAWYEVLPAFSITIPDFNINPGDRVFASISMIDTNQSTWKILLEDITNGKSFTKNIEYNSTQSSGEWIIERPTVNSQVSTLTNFGTITFTDCNIGLENKTGPIGEFIYTKIEMTNQLATPLTTVSSLSPDGGSFNVTHTNLG